MDIIQLQETLDRNLAKRQARDSGICPVREDLYHQCFDEIIRQVTIFGPERGLLLLRVRDEIRMTIDAYKTLYDSSVIFGIRKQKQSEDGMEEMRQNIRDLEEKKARLNLEVLELRNKVDILQKRIAEEQAVEQKNYQEQTDFIKHQIGHFEQYLKSLDADAN